MTVFGFYIEPQAIWLYVGIAVLVFLGLDVNTKNDFVGFVWRVLVSAFHPFFWLICAVKKL